MTLEQARTAYIAGAIWQEKLIEPLPKLLAILGIPSYQLEGAPDEYKDDLALMHLTVGGMKVLSVEAPKEAKEIVAFARQLFGFLGIQHRVGICFSRGVGCCLRPEFLLPDGSLTDVYFTKRADDERQKYKAVLQDVWNALIVTCDLGREDVGLIASSLRVAATQYTNRTDVAHELEDLIESSAQGITRGETVGLEALLRIIVAPA
jgi:hypothetical protein